MNDVFPLPGIPGYVDIKEAARILGVAESSVYRYIQAGRLPAYQAGRNIMVESKALNQCKPRLTGRPRKKQAPPWRASTDAGTFSVMYIRVQVYPGQQAALERVLWKMKQEERHVFPGTVMRYISLDDTSPATVTIQLVWRNDEMPGEESRQQELAAFKSELAAVLNWETAQYSTGRVIIHT
jgi:excisionase family DNA binding protein